MVDGAPTAVALILMFNMTRHAAVDADPGARGQRGLRMGAAMVVVGAITVFLKLDLREAHDQNRRVLAVLTFLRAS